MNIYIYIYIVVQRCAGKNASKPVISPGHRQL